MKIFHTLVDLLQSFENNTSSGITFLSDTEEDTLLPYQDLLKRALKRLWHLQQAGIKKKDNLILYIEDTREFLITFWAALLGGIIPVPVTVGVNDELKQKLLNIWEVCRPARMVTYEWAYKKIKEYITTKVSWDKSGEFEDRTLIIENFKDREDEGNIANVKKSDTAFIQFSSGSTGNPRGIILSHENIIANIDANVKMSGTTAADSSLNWFPLTHDMGIIGFHLSSIWGGINFHIMSPQLFARNPLLWLEKAARYRVTLLGTSNFGLKHLLNCLNNSQLSNLDLSGIRLIFIGAETISPFLCRNFLEIFGKYGLKENTLYPVYGLAEATVAVTFSIPGDNLSVQTLDSQSLKIGSEVVKSREGSPGSSSFVEVGIPVRKCRVRICDLHDRVLGDKTLGHIQVQGINVTSGYVNDARATRELFTKDGWLKTGDLGFLSEGKLTVTGRIKDIIFANGRNFFPYDIERVVEELPLIRHGKTAAVGAFDGKEGEEIALLFIVYKKDNWNEFNRIAAEIKRHLYRQMGLSVKHVIPVKTIPRTTSGKKQHYKLRNSFFDGELDEVLAALARAQSYDENTPDIHPELSTETESRLMKLWQETFQKKVINPDDDFFSLGGDSLKASYLVTRISRDFHVDFDLEKLFHFPTVKKTAEYIDDMDQITNIIIPRAAEKEFYPLSSAQKRMFILNRLNNRTAVYNITLAVRIYDKFDEKKIVEIFRQLIDRHESLRTEFRLIKNKPVQHIRKEVSFKLTFLTRLDSYDEETIAGILRNFVKPFNLEEAAQLFRVGIILFDADSFILAIDIHHIISDGTSLFILIRDFLKLYTGEALSPLTIQYKDYSEWYRETVMTDNKLIKQKEFWLNVFKDGIPLLNLPADRESPPEKSFNGAEVSFTLETALSDIIKKFTAEYRITLNIFILTVFNILLYKYTGQSDIVVGCPVSGRNYTGIADVTGIFVNTLCIRNYPSGEQTFLDFLQSVKRQTLLAYKNQDYPFEELVENLNIQRDLKHNPLFDVMLIMHLTGPESLSSGKIRIENYPVLQNTSMFNLVLNVFNINDKISFSFEFNSDIFYRKTIRRLINHFINIIQAVIDDPGRKLKEIRIISDAEENQLLYDFSGSPMEYPQSLTFQELFEQQAGEHPDRTAVVFNDNTLTYKALNEKANRLAHYLVSHYPVKPDTIIGIMLERSLELIVCLLAVLKSGAAYLPLNPRFPVHRIHYMIDDCRCLLVITNEEFSRLLQDRYEPLIFRQDMPRVNSCSKDNLPARSAATDLLYTIYTSGTTGSPRGVMVQHNQFINISYGWRNVYSLDSMPVNLLQLADFSFDVFAGDLGRSLLNGGTLVICPREKQLDFASLYALISRYNVTIFESTPSLIVPFIEYAKFNNLPLKQLKVLILGSDICTAADFMEIHAYLHPHTRLINSYGTTEATVDSTWFEGTIRENLHKQITPVGKPFPNIKIYILDHYLKLQPVNIPGELCIGGKSVSRGYLGRKNIPEKFTENPYAKGTKLYRTGDIARWREDGNIEFLGRMDNQIKIRGYRINPVEIESLIRKHPGINDTVVVAREFFPGDLRLVAYILTNLLISSEDIDQYLQTYGEIKTSRRNEFRIPYEVPCRVRLMNGKEYDFTVTNISYSGLSVKQRDLVVGGDRIGLTFPLPGGQMITINALVNYSHSAMINFIFDDNPGKRKILKEALDRMAGSRKIIVFDLRRSEYRIMFNRPCLVHVSPQDKVEVTARDISFSGISVRTVPGICTAGDNVKMSMQLPFTRKRITLNGVVIWKNEKEAGIKFTEENSTAVRQDLADFIRHKRFTVQDLRAHLETRLPEYMIPSVFVIVDKIPLTANGKVDRLKLPEPNFGLFTGTDHSPPSSVSEKVIAELWQEVLGIQNIGINDNFFLIGGNSSKALYAALKSGNLFTISDLFKFPTIRLLAENLKRVG